MADTSDFRNGLIIKFKDGLYTITEFQHVKPGKGGAFVRTTLKNVKTGKVLDNTFRAGEKVEVVRVERKKFQYLYKESDSLVVMDYETYEQINVPVAMIGDGEAFLKESTDIEMLFDDKDQIVTVELPLFAELEVVETEPGFKGDTATNAVKPAKLETGATINVPLFINEGDLLRIDTRKRAYHERMKK